MSYVVGFFAADGYITVNRRGGQFWCIQITDKQLLYKIREVIGAEHKISERLGVGNEKAQYRLQIGSIEMCDDLRKLGFRENKTSSLAVPNVQEQYLSDFIRGYFDGDGNVWSGKTHKARGRGPLTLVSVFTSCSEAFLKKLKIRLNQSGLNGGSICKTKGNYFRLQFSVKDSLKLYDFMYNSHVLGSGLFLKRKKTIFEKYKSLRL